MDHLYEGLFQRAQKIWKRSANYSKTAFRNPNFPRTLKIIGVGRLIFSLGVNISLLGLFYNLDLAVASALVCLLSLLFIDRGIQARYFFKYGGIHLLIAAPIFIYFEYTLAGAGALYHFYSSLLKYRKLNAK